MKILEQGNAELPPPANTSKQHLHVEQFSLKTNSRLAERLLHNQSCKERSTQSWKEGRRSDQVETRQ